MLTFLICLFISVLLSFGTSVALVIKGKDWPIRRYNITLRWWLRKYVHTKAQRVLLCVVCTSFWMTIFSDLAVCSVSYQQTGHGYWFWPCSGFITLGLTYAIFRHFEATENIKLSIPES